MIPGAVRVEGKLTQTEVLHGLTGRDWWAWRFGGRRGRRYIIRFFLGFMRFTQEKLDDRPLYIVFPNGMRYRIVNMQGEHEPL